MPRSHRRIILAAGLSALLLGGACDRKSKRAEPSDARSSAARGAVDSSAGAPGAENAASCQLVEDGHGPRGEVAVRAEVVARGLEVPWGIVFVEGGDMLVSERDGRLRAVRDGQLVPEPVATIDITARGEGGLLDIQAHPNFTTNGLFYLYITVRKSGRAINRVELWKLDRGERWQASRQRIVVDDIPAGRFHNGGRMRIGPDGMLYVGTGDATDAERSQRADDLAGKILRFDLDGNVPADNPFENSPTWILGVRNTQGFDWRDDATLLVTDHGPSGELGRRGHDEVTVARRGDNLGWPTIYKCEEKNTMITPALTWQEATPPGGAAIYTGSSIPAWQGSLLIGTLGSRHLHRVVFAEGSDAVERHEVYFPGDPPEGLGRLREVMMGPDGELYVTTSNCDGRGSCPSDKDKIYRIVAE